MGEQEKLHFMEYSGDCIMKKKIIVRGPALSRSGYGEQCRFALRALNSRPDLFDIYLITTNWGITSWIHENIEEREWLDELIIKTNLYLQQNKNPSMDISLQVTIPNEWEKMAPVNVGYTAGIETTQVTPAWIEKSQVVDRIITVSNHSKQIYENTSYQMKNADGEVMDANYKCNNLIFSQATRKNPNSGVNSTQEDQTKIPRKNSAMINIGTDIY